MRDSSTVRSGSSYNSASNNPHLNGAALIEADGREVPITEEMICAALDALNQDMFYRPQDHGRANRLR